ncbi:hypothetical protein [Aeromicrobium alkaliterrae]|uniref:BON domain-containing protein n=1 Tax=Aeromicrobium alkaliterrae TaxID=302168 RepID=A0ABN2JTE0_9ACTN
MSWPEEDRDPASRVEQLRERLIQTMVGELDHPHVVVCHSRASNRITLLGPYGDGLAAVLAAEAERRSASGPRTAGDVVYLVAPIDQREAGE